MRYFFALVFSLAVASTTAQSTIYQFSLPTSNGAQIDFSAFGGKKILVVNISTQSQFSSQQLDELRQLYNQLKDSGLVIVGIPSNSFGSEPLNSADAVSTFRNFYHIDFPISILQDVKGASISVLYRWLTSKAENGLMDSEVKADFQKYLINSSGKLVGVFSSKVTANSEVLRSSIQITQ